jgi:hypothetical protein
MEPGSDTNPLREWFERNDGRLIDKWMHYFEVYHRHFQRFRGRPCTVLEIGVQHGGSLRMWREYFGPEARIVGVDVNPECAKLAEPGMEIVIGDQADRAFLRALYRRYAPIDVLIDDGGHKMPQQMATMQELFGAVGPHGVLLFEDLHTSYWREYGGGYRMPFSFIEFAKMLVDQLNAWHSRDEHSFAPTDYTRAISGLHFYDSMLVIDKAPREPPERRRTGHATLDVE